MRTGTEMSGPRGMPSEKPPTIAQGNKFAILLVH
jgi:hypothetical protein